MKDIFNLNNKIAVITGGCGQLGQEFAYALCSYGAKVALIDLLENPKKKKKGLDEFLSSKNAKFFKIDITNKSDLFTARNQIEKLWGIPDILINAAAIDSPPDAPVNENGPFEYYPEESLNKIIDVNIKGTVYCCQVFGEAMVKKGKGSIINISSIYGLVSPNQDIYAYKRKNGKEWYKPSAYALTKSSIFNLTRYLATYWAKKGVRVNTLTPAGIFNNQDKEFLDEYTKKESRLAEWQILMN